MSGSVVYCSISRCTVSVDLIVANGIVVFTAGISGVSFNSVNYTILHFFYNAHMITCSVLRAGITFVIPIKENNIARTRFIAVILP